MQLPQNSYPNYTNFVEASFPQEVTPPDVDPDVDMMCVRYNPAWAKVLAAACDQLTQLASWAGDAETKKLAVNRASNLKELLQQFERCCDMCCCNPPPLSRITANGVYEQSTDGGLTWTPEPGADPRNQATALPPQTGTDAHDVRCKTANSIVAFLQHAQTEYYNQLLAGATISDLVAAGLLLLALIGIVATGGAFAAIGLAMASILIGVDAATFASFFTSGGWDDLTCKIYCDIDANGKVRPGAFSDIANSAVSVFGNNQGGNWLKQFINGMGTGGLENAGAVSSTNSASCDACGCAECPYDANLLTVCPGAGMTIVKGACASGLGINVNHLETPGYYSAVFEVVLNEPCSAPYYHVSFNYGTGHANSENWFDVARERDGSGALIWISGHDSQFSIPNGTSTQEGILNPAADPPIIAFRLNVNDGGYLVGDDYITHIVVNDTPPP